MKLSKRYGYDLRIEGFDWGTFIRNKDEEIRRLNQIYERNLGKAGVKTFKGRGILIDSTSVSVGGERLQADKIILAVGGKPRLPDIEGVENAITSDQVFHLESLPEKMAIVGGGYIAVEFASIFHDLGVDVTLVYRGSLFLKNFDKEISRFVMDSMRENGLSMKLNSNIARIRNSASRLKIVFDDECEDEFDQVVFCVGREPKLEGLGLEKTKVRLKGGKIKVDESFRTDDPSIFALGDVASPKELTPVAIREGVVLIGNLFGGGDETMNYENVPTAVFCRPNIGSVGLTEEEARNRHEQIEVRRSVFRSMKTQFGGVGDKTIMKLIVDSASDQVVGMHMAGDEAGEIIQGFAVAVKAGITFKQLKQTIAIHPTNAEEFVTI